jgi:hypothetical protein
VRDVILSRVLSRDQIIRLGYFHSVCRANARLASLVGGGVLRVLKTPFFGQHLYAGASDAIAVAGPRVGLHLVRGETPQFVQHALAVTDTRLALLARDYNWRFEAQVRHKFSFRGQNFDVRPDGVAFKVDRAMFVEVDLGHTSQSRFLSRFAEYRAFVESGEFKALFEEKDPVVLVVTTGSLRARRLDSLTNGSNMPPIRVVASKELGVEFVGGWS